MEVEGMRLALTAIQELFDSTDALKSRFPGGCYLTTGPTDSALPFCRVSVVDGVSTPTTCDSVETLPVRFSVFAEDDVFALDAVREIKAAFNRATLNFTGFISLLKTGEGLGKDEDEKVWHAYVFFDLQYAE